MESPTPDNLAGFKYVTIILAFVGAAFSLSTVPPMTGWRAVVSAAISTLSAAGAATVLAFIWPMPAPVEGAAAFFTGLFSLKLMPAVLDMIVRNLQKIEFPSWGAK